MALDDLKDQLKDNWATLSQKIQDHPAYQTLLEKYETLPQVWQKVLIFGSAILFSLFLASIPYGFFSQSTDYTDDFVQTRELIRDLLKFGKAGRNSVSLSNMSAANLKSRVESILARKQLLPKQSMGIKDLGPTRGSLAKPPIIEEAISVNLGLLNLNQVVEIGYDLQKISNAVKMTGVNIIESKGMKGYFNVAYTLSLFKVPETKSDEKSKTKKRSRRRGGK